MKKISLALTGLALTSLLVACQQVGDDADDKTYKATLTVEFEGKTDTKEVTFEEGDTVMDVLEDYHEVEEDQGMVTSIDGISQDEATMTYWMYDVNDELASKGAEELRLKEGDQVKFYLETFE